MQTILSLRLKPITVFHVEVFAHYIPQTVDLKATAAAAAALMFKLLPTTALLLSLLQTSSQLQV